jgi:lipid A 3-O-deacylase
MRQLKLLFFLLFGTPFLGLSQTIDRQQVGVELDNDLYTSLKNDRYYTNGITLFYAYLNQKQSSILLKKITEFRIGQYIYTPRTRLANAIKDNDRPFAGYLFGEANQTFFMNNHTVYHGVVQIGFVGPNSFAEEIQNGLHDAFSLRHVQGWQNQIKNTLALQTQFRFSQKLFPNATTAHFDIHFQGQAILGTVQTALNSGFFARIGLKNLQPIVSSNFYNQGVLGAPKTEELYFFIHPSLQYQAYDATVQGSLFGTQSPVELGLIRWRWHTALGIKYRYNHFNCHYTFFYRSKEVNHPVNTGYYYGSIGLTYSFR